MLVFTPSQSLFKAGVPSGEINFVYNIARKFQLRERASHSYGARSWRQQTNPSRKKISIGYASSNSYASFVIFPRTSYLDERTLTYEPIVKYTSAMCEETLLAQSRQNRLKSVSTRAPGSRASCHHTDCNETLPVWRVYPKTKKDKLVSLLVFSGGDRPPPQGNRFKIGKMYEALTVMVFNQLFWAFAHIFLHP